MDFSNRNAQSQPATPGAAATATGGSGGKKRSADRAKWTRLGVAAAVAAIVILFVGLIVTAAFGGDKKESEYVDASKLQAVFLNTGQVYFGNISVLNGEHVVLNNIYYLQTANTGAAAGGAAANTNVTLVKLGCELHEPYDQMVINRDQVTFWENLQDNGQVATAVATFQKQHPDGQKCADQSTSSSNTSNSVQSAGSNSGGGTTNTPSTTPTNNAGN